MGLVGKAAKKAAEAAAKKAKHKVNGGCPGSTDGKHKMGSDVINGHRVISCRRCGRM